MRNRLSPTRLRKRSPLLGIEGLEDRVVPAAILNITNALTGIFPQFDLVDPNPNPAEGGTFGSESVILSTGNIVVTDPFDNAGGVNAGAVYLFNGTTGALISTLTGSHANDNVGSLGVTALTNGNFVVTSFSWDNGSIVDAGAVTWGSGITGVSGVVSASNSLVGSKPFDYVGGSKENGFNGVNFNKSDGVKALTNGNYVVRSPVWANGNVASVGAVTWGDGTKGISGAVTPENSLVGSHTDDIFPVRSSSNITVLTNGNYVVRSIGWDNGMIVDVGAVTWGDGTAGVSGVISAANSLFGTQSNDRVGSSGVKALANGNYVVASDEWKNGPVLRAGAVTWGNGTAGTTGAVSATNSLVGTRDYDYVGLNDVVVLTNGNYVVASSTFAAEKTGIIAALTWADGTKGISGAITSSNSIVSMQGQGVGVASALANGNYVVIGFDAVSNTRAVMWVDGSKGINGIVTDVVTVTKSLVVTDDGMLKVIALTNGNYVINDSSGVGSVTWADGTKTTTGTVSAANSLVGLTANNFDTIVVTPLANGNYVVNSYKGVTWGNGTTGTRGTVSAANSLVGSQTDAVGNDGVTALANGNYVVSSSRFPNGVIVEAGATTWGNGTTGISGTVSAANSLVGTQNFERASLLMALTDGNYLARSGPAGAITWVNGSTGKTIDGLNVNTRQNSIVPLTDFSPPWSRNFSASSHEHVFLFNVITNAQDRPSDSRRITVGLPDANLLSFDRGGSTTLNVTPDLFAMSLNAGNAVVSQAKARISVTAPIVIDNPTGNGGALTLQSQGVLNLIANITTDNGNLTLLGTTITTSIGTTITTGTGTLNLPTGSLVLNGTITVNGGLSLSGVSLNAQLPLPIVPGQSIILIDKRDAGPIVGTFAGLPQGSVLTRDGRQYAISYSGGDGNDAVLTRFDTVVNTAPGISRIDDQSSLANAIGPLNFVVNDFETPAGSLVVSATSSNLTLIPNDAIVLGNSVGVRTVSVTPTSGISGRSTIVLTVIDSAGATTTSRFLVTITAQPVALVGVPQFAVGTDAGRGSATLFNPDKSVRFAVAPFAGFTGGVRTATADFNGDGVADLVVGTGPGIATQVRIFDGKTQAELFFVAPFEDSFTGGVYISAGDVNGDGIPDLAITPDEGGGPRADVYSGVAGFPKIASFFGIDDPNFRGGARSAIADMTGDGTADLIVVAGFGGGPRVAAFDGKSLSTGSPVKIFGDFFAFEQSLRNGIFVTAGDINGDGFADLIAGGGPGGGPRVLALDGKSLLRNQYVNLANFFGGDISSRGGIRVAVKNLDGDTKADLVVGSGTGAGSRVTGYLGKNIEVSGVPTGQFDFELLDGFSGGVFVG